MTDCRTITTDDGVELLDRVDGETSGPPVVILHGYMNDGVAWREVVLPLVDTGYFVVRPDHRGHGGSANLGDESAYSFDRLCRDTLAVVDHLGVDTFHLVGHSMGGYLAQMLSIGHQERLRSLVLVDCSPMPGSPDRAWAARLRRFVAYRIGPGRLTRLLAPFLSRLTIGSSSGRTREERRAGLDDFVRSAEMHDPAAFVALGEQLQAHDDLRPFLPEITVPTTVVVGENEVAKLRAGADALAAGIPGAAFEIVDDAGHGAPMEQPEQFTRILLDHLQTRERSLSDD